MTVLLVLMTLILCLAVDRIVLRARQARAARAMGPMAADAESGFPEGIAFAANHMWTREERGTLTVGVDGFIASLAGSVEAVILPGRETRLVPSASGVVLRHAGKDLRLAVPVPGAVTEVNEAVVRNPALLTSDPYGAGWLVKVRRLDNAMPALRTIPRQEVVRWMREQGTQAREFFAARLPQPVLMQDGGVPVQGLLKEFSADVWREFEERFLSNETDR